MICVECALILQHTPTFRHVFPARHVSLSEIEEAVEKLQCVICTQIYRASEKVSSPFHILRDNTPDGGAVGQLRPGKFMLSYALEIGDKANSWGVNGKICYSRESLRVIIIKETRTGHDARRVFEAVRCRTYPDRRGTTEVLLLSTESRTEAGHFVHDRV